MQHDNLISAVRILGSQAKLAARVGLTQQQISRLMNGKQRVTAEVAIAIERATGGEIRREALRPDIFSEKVEA